jgi:hypothetical protein
MTLTLLLIGGVVLAVAAVSVVNVRSAEVVDPILAGEAAVGRTDPASETLAGPTETPPPPALAEWHLLTVSALCEAEDLLDCLEAQGYQERELIVLGNCCFAVRWR